MIYSQCDNHQKLENRLKLVHNQSAVKQGTTKVSMEEVKPARQTSCGAVKQGTTKVSTEEIKLVRQTPCGAVKQGTTKVSTEEIKIGRAHV